jgi:hypothetical protein
MNNDAMIFALVFIAAITVICSGVVFVALNRVSRSGVRAHRRKSTYRSATAHRAFKDVM